MDKMDKKEISNPFTSKKPVKDHLFAGREEILKKIYGYINADQSVSLVGERRTGKTSILRRIMDSGKNQLIHPDHQHVFVFQDFLGLDYRNMTDIWTTLLSALQKEIAQIGLGKLGRRVTDAIEQLQSGEFALPTLQSLFSTIARNKVWVSFLFDEFEATVQEKNPVDLSFYKILRSLAIDMETKLNYVIATRQKLSEVEMHLEQQYTPLSSPLYNIFYQLIIQPLSEEEARRMVISYLASVGLDKSTMLSFLIQKDLLFQLSSFHPFFLQIACHHIFEHCVLPDGTFADQVPEDEIISAFLSEADSHFAYYWGISSEEEKRLLKKLSIAPIYTDTDNHPNLNNLLSRCLVTKKESEWRLFSSAFAVWIKVENQMSNNVKKLVEAYNPIASLDYIKLEDRKYYIDFSPVRSDNLIRGLKRTIILSSQPTCQLFTGHIGCGKSTELLRLKAELKQENYHVVYFESSEEWDMNDIDITDILLVMARKIGESLAGLSIDINPSYFRKLFSEIKEFLKTEIDLSSDVQFSMGLAEITNKTKNPRSRNKLRNYLEPRTDSIIDSINIELIETARQKLKERGKKGLVVIVDNLDRIIDKLKTSERTQSEYIFFDRGGQLKRLNCHLVYTFPLILMFSNDAAIFKNNFGFNPGVLGMIPVQSRDGKSCEEGIALLKQMVMIRAFPDSDETERLNKVEELFEHADMLDKICRISGGHIRNLLRFLYSCLQNEDPPLSERILNKVIQREQDDLVRSITPDEWELLRQVIKTQSVAGERECQILLRSMFVFEYEDDRGIWFGVNPLLADTDKLKSE